MTQLFLRFYVGVIAILMVSWLIQAYIFLYANQEANIAVVEKALEGGALLVRDEIVRGGEAEYAQTIQRINSRFPYPVAVVARNQRSLPKGVINRVDRGDVVLHWKRVYCTIGATEYLVELGPLPSFVGPPGPTLLLGLWAISVLTAIGIAVLLRPVAIQLRSVERAALAIAGGDLSARIDDRVARRKFLISDAFNRMASRVEKVMQTQRELLQAVSHEFRTPLARIQFATELGRSATTIPQVQERLGAIDEATEQLNSLVGELLTYTRLEHEDSKLQHLPVDLLQVVNSVVDLHKSMHPRIAFSVQAKAAEITSDPSAVRRAVENLVSNAGKYATSRVEVSIELGGDTAKVTVADDGPGIKPADRKAVFEPFTRLVDSVPGTGLGLALVHRICNRLRGDVTIRQSTLGGALVEITLPIATG